MGECGQFKVNHVYEKAKCFRQVICRQECLKVPSSHLPSQVIGVNLALFADNPCLYATRHKEGNVLRKVQRWSDVGDEI
jgi:hypothetical protein